jgi:hypothetical protein
MFFYTFIGLFTLAAAQSRDCNGVPHGQSVDVGRYYYTCKDGMLDPTGCLSEANERAPIGSTFKRNDFVMLCKLGADGYMVIEYSACLIGGKTVQPGDTSETANQWYTCAKQANNYLMQKASGCIYKTKRVNLGEKVREETALLECREDAKGVPAMIENGCVSDGKEYQYGDSFTDDKFWYFCGTNDQGKSMRKVIGCVYEGKKLYDGQIFYRDDVIFRCLVQEYKTARHAPVGCVKRDANGQEVHKSIGCYWIDGEAPHKFSVMCNLKNETCVKTKFNCYYAPGRYEVILEPGCFRKFEDKTIGCKPTPDGQVEYVTLDPTRIDLAISQGLHLC